VLDFRIKLTDDRSEARMAQSVRENFIVDHNELAARPIFGFM
jgi:hypothetical protein